MCRDAPRLAPLGVGYTPGTHFVGSLRPLHPAGQSRANHLVTLLRRNISIYRLTGSHATTPVCSRNESRKVSHHREREFKRQEKGVATFISSSRLSHRPTVSFFFPPVAVS